MAQDSPRLMKCVRSVRRTLATMSTPAIVRKHALNLVTAVLFGVAIWRLGFSAELPAVLAFIFGGVLLAAIDWKAHRLPTTVVYATLAAVGLGLVFASIVERDWVPLATALVGAVAFANVFFLIWLITTKYAGLSVIGLGDVRLAAVLGLMLGWFGLPYVVYGAVAGHLLAALVAAVTCLRTRQVQMTYSFGPPLIAGTLGVVLLYA